MQTFLRAAAGAFANLADKAQQWADWLGGVDPAEAAQDFAGVNLVGIDFSTSIRKVACHVIRGWERYRRQVEALCPDHGIWAFGVNALPFPLTPRPVPPRQLPSFCEENFQPRGYGQGLIEYGSAFYDYLLMALKYARRYWDSGGNGRAPVPITISLLCDGWPNGGNYRADDVRPLVEEARTRGVRFKLVGFALRRHRDAMQQFPASLGLTPKELEYTWYDEGGPDEQTVTNSFDRLAGIGEAEADPQGWYDATMTPEEWDGCQDPQAMLDFLRSDRSRPLVRWDSRGLGRRFRLFACACCWRLAPLLGEERSRHAVEAAERFADGLASAGEMAAAAFPVPVAVGWVTDGDAGRAAVMAAMAAARTPAAQPTGSSAWANWCAERIVQAVLARCIFGPLRRRPVSIPAPILARGGTARRLAKAIYTGRRFENLPVLADLLEEAGYADAAILAHLRGPGPHAKGCHALDAVLRKT